MLHYETIIPETKEILHKLMKEPELLGYRLAGGTGLSLLKGHRMSDDLDLFISGYESYKKPEVKRALHRIFPSPVSVDIRDNMTFGTKVYYYPNTNIDDAIKIDIMNWDPEDFIKEANVIDGIRLASLEDLSAMKLNAIGDRYEKKDFIDIDELLNNFTLKEMLGFYEKRYPYNEMKSVFLAISKIDKADDSKMPKMLNSKTWGNVKENITNKLKEHFNQEAELKMKNKGAIIKEILQEKPKKNKGKGFSM